MTVVYIVRSVTGLRSIKSGRCLGRAFLLEVPDWNSQFGATDVDTKALGINFKYIYRGQHIRLYTLVMG